MNSEVLILESAKKELSKFDIKVKDDFYKLFVKLENREELDRSKYKKLSGYNLFELRVRHNGNIFRGIGGYINPKLLLTVFFQKKSQKLPQNFIRLATKRFNQYIKDNKNEGFLKK